MCGTIETKIYYIPTIIAVESSLSAILEDFHSSSKKDKRHAERKILFRFRKRRVKALCVQYMYPCNITRYACEYRQLEIGARAIVYTNTPKIIIHRLPELKGTAIPRIF